MVDQPTDGTAATAVSRGAGHLTGLTGLRGVGALVVVAYHLGIGPVDGHLGVEIFFVLSGFVGMRAELRRVGSRTFAVADFLVRRVERILPALAVFVAVRLGFLLWFTTPVRVEEFISALTFTSNLVYINGSPPWAMVITWSLAVEMQFALVFAVIMRLTGLRLSRLRTTLVALILASTAWRIVLLSAGASSVRLRYGLDTRLDQLLFGCLLAVLLHQPGTARRTTWTTWTTLTRRIVHPMTTVLAITAIVASVVADTQLGRSYRYGMGMTIDMVAFGILICAVVMAARTAAPARWADASPLHWPVLVWIGHRSYSLYLYHALVYRLTLRWWPGRTPLKLAVVIAISLMVAAVSHRMVEQGAVRLIERRHGRRDRRAVGTSRM